MRPRPRRLRRALRACEDAVSEVIGYILMFFLSSAVLMLSLQAFLESRNATENLQAASEVRLIADQVASEIFQAGLAAEGLRNATYEGLVKLPNLGGRSYLVNASHDRVYVNTTDGRFMANSTVFRVNATVQQIHGTVYSGQGYAKVRYQNQTGWGTIELTI